MKASDFAQRCKKIATDYKTVYVWGAIGMPVTSQNVAAKVKQYPSNRTSGHEKKALALVGKNAFMFDCVCLIKAVLWGWNGDFSKSYGGAKYASNGVPDINADTMITKCSDISTNFSSIQVGEVVWMPGHIGVYIGDGICVECTPSFKNGVQITACLNIEAKNGYYGRTWIKHGKLPYVDYELEISEIENAKQIIKAKAALTDATIKYLADYRFGDDLLKKLAAAMK